MDQAIIYKATVSVVNKATGDYPPLSTTNIKRRELLPSKIFPDKERTRGGFLSTQFLSNESLSSGYSTDHHDDLHTKNQQLGERRDHLLGENTLISKTIKRKSSFFSNEEENANDSLQ